MQKAEASVGKDEVKRFEKKAFLSHSIFGAPKITDVATAQRLRIRIWLQRSA